VKSLKRGEGEKKNLLLEGRNYPHSCHCLTLRLICTVTYVEK